MLAARLAARPLLRLRRLPLAASYSAVPDEPWAAPKEPCELRSRYDALVQEGRDDEHDAAWDRLRPEGVAAAVARARYDVAETLTGDKACEAAGLDALGITRPTTVFRNLTFEELRNHELANGEGVLARAAYGDTFAVDTGEFTGRSPSDKWTVRRAGSESEKHLWWGPVNKPMRPEVFDELLAGAVEYFDGLDKVYVADLHCGASAGSRINVRFVHELAWQQHFVTNMFIRPESLAGFLPTDERVDFTIVNACALRNENWEAHGLNSDVAVAFDLERKLAVIYGTYYGGENKKGIFSLMNYLLPLRGILSMHCSANVGESGDVALFFGLSGTGKTTLSADPKRALIGDDEHGWDDAGVFNFEGGCYAKTADLEESSEPDIFRAIRADAMLENVALADGAPDYANTSKTPNGRVSYPIHHIPTFHRPQAAGHPETVVFLTCDAFGVLPPVSRLSEGQAMYHYLSGYTAKVAGTERGVTEPTATFSACFGAAFLTLHPTVYADLLRDKLRRHGATAYLVNTGWAGGGYGVGERMAIDVTRACVDAVLDGSIQNADFATTPVFGLDVPTALPGVDAALLDPRRSWADPAAYDAALEKLGRLYRINFEQYDSPDVAAHGPDVSLMADERAEVAYLVASEK